MQVKLDFEGDVLRSQSLQGDTVGIRSRAGQERRPSFGLPLKRVAIKFKTLYKWNTKRDFRGRKKIVSRQEKKQRHRGANLAGIKEQGEICR